MSAVVRVLRKIIGTLLMMIVFVLSLPLMTLALLMSALATIFNAIGKGTITLVNLTAGAVSKLGGWKKDEAELL